MFISCETAPLHNSPFEYASPKITQTNQSPFLMVLPMLEASLALDQEWADRYDDVNSALVSAHFDEMLQLMVTAPDEFARGVIFGKISVLQSITNQTGRELDVLDPQLVQLHTGAFLNCSTQLQDLGEWSINYEDTQSINSMLLEDECLLELEALLHSAPNDLARGTMFGKMTLLLELQNLTQKH